MFLLRFIPFTLLSIGRGEKGSCETPTENRADKSQGICLYILQICEAKAKLIGCSLYSPATWYKRFRRNMNWFHGFASLKVPVAVGTKNPSQRVAHLKRQATKRTRSPPRRLSPSPLNCCVCAKTSLLPGPLGPSISRLFYLWACYQSSHVVVLCSLLAWT